MKNIRKTFLVFLLMLTLAACSLGASASLTNSTSSTSSNTASSNAVSNLQATPAATAAASVEAALIGLDESHADAQDYVWDSAQEVGITLNNDSITTDAASVIVDGSKATIISDILFTGS